MKQDTNKSNAQNGNAHEIRQNTNDHGGKLNYLDVLSESYDCFNDFFKINKELNARIMMPYLNKKKGGVALELGCGIGESTAHLAPLFSSLTVCDGSDFFLRKAKDRLRAYKHIEFKQILFENINDEYLYDFIIANYILEHVDDTENILTVCYNALKQGGYLFITVPNAKALSRQLAVKMGLLDNIYSLTENDIKHGHKRVFDIDILKEKIAKTKFNIITHGGVYVKPLADFQLKQLVEAEI